MIAEPALARPAATVASASNGHAPRPGRSVAARRQRAREEARRGNRNAMLHGLFAVIALQPDVAVEVELQLTLHPGLDPLADLRLVETFALASVHHRLASQAIAREGLTEHLGSFISRQAPLVERLEREVYDRGRRRLADATKDPADVLGRYRSGGGS